MIQRLKNCARLKKQSLNSFVTSALEEKLDGEDKYQSLREQLSRIPRDTAIPADLKSLVDNAIVFTAAELTSDEKLQYILSK